MLSFFLEGGGGGYGKHGYDFNRLFSKFLDLNSKFFFIFIETSFSFHSFPLIELWSMFPSPASSTGVETLNATG